MPLATLSILPLGAKRLPQTTQRMVSFKCHKWLQLEGEGDRDVSVWGTAPPRHGEQTVCVYRSGYQTRVMETMG